MFIQELLIFLVFYVCLFFISSKRLLFINDWQRLFIFCFRSWRGFRRFFFFKSISFFSLASLLLSMLSPWTSGKCCAIAFGIFIFIWFKLCFGDIIVADVDKSHSLIWFLSTKVMILFLFISKLSKEVNWLIPSSFSAHFHLSLNSSRKAESD